MNEQFVYNDSIISTIVDGFDVRVPKILSIMTQ